MNISYFIHVSANKDNSILTLKFCCKKYEIKWTSLGIPCLYLSSDLPRDILSHSYWPHSFSPFLCSLQEHKNGLKM